MVSQLTLFVFIIGSQDSCFCVKIESSETVGDLKDSILEKCKNSLKSVNADRLALYQVELPDGETLGALAAQAVKERKELSPSTPLFEIFPTDPPEETISILVNILDVIRDGE
jgi:Crinkler effector protein N-terminal domain